MRIQSDDIFLEAYNSRVNIVRSLSKIKDESDSESLVNSILNDIDRIIELLGKNPISRVYLAYKDLVVAYQCLAQWKKAIRNATVDADRFHRAYMENVKDARKKIKELRYAKELFNILSLMETINTTDDINMALESLSSLSLPLPIYRELKPELKNNHHSGLNGSEEKEIVAFLEFKVNNENLQFPHIIEPNKLYDLNIKIRINKWANNAEKIIIQPLSSISPENYEMPTFEFPKDESINTYQQTKKMCLKVEQSLESQPLEFVYQAYLLPMNLTVSITGMNRINIRSESDGKLLISGYEIADRSLSSIRRTLYKEPSLSQKQKRNFLLIMKHLANIAGQALASNDFPNDWEEKNFQHEIRKRLRQIPEIGSDLLEHPHAAGGITDLFFNKLHLELKVVKDYLVTLDNAVSFSQQAAQYTTGCDNQLGVICILDCSEKKEAPGSLANDIGLKYIPAPGVTTSGFPLILGVIIIRGNLPPPSSFSK